MINNWLPALILSLIVCLVVQEAEASLISEFAAIDTPLDNGTGVNSTLLNSPLRAVKPFMIRGWQPTKNTSTALP